jgi:hypothetical protein
MGLLCQLTLWYSPIYNKSSIHLTLISFIKHYLTCNSWLAILDLQFLTCNSWLAILDLQFLICNSWLAILDLQCSSKGNRKAQIVPQHGTKIVFSRENVVLIARLLYPLCCCSCCWCSWIVIHVQQKDARWRPLLQITICIPIGI